MPTSTLLQLLLIRSTSDSVLSPIHLTLADYNVSVLYLSTIPNLLLTHSLHRICSKISPSPTAPRSSSDLELSPSTLSSFSADISRRNIHIAAISGAWGPEFTNLISSQAASFLPPSFFHDPTTHSRPETLILASETIYSPTSLQRFTSTLFGLLEAAEASGGRATALVAAKRVYFGVGGGVQEFLAAVSARGGVADVVWESRGGVGRVILEVRRTG